ncbi:uncharacterized protein [Cherax quadricarinatus]|uniref:uncharacterized protein n=1 Tax=Cherax quadricarinatus TaxID=27406 RepID=UPI00387EDF4E
MRVVDLPDGRPVIKGVKSQYLPVDWVDLTCVSRRSKPPAQLSFLINTQPVSTGWLEPQVNQMGHDGLTTSSLRLRFSLQPRLLQEGDAKVLCISRIPGIYQQEAEGVLTTRSPYHASVLGGGAPPGTRGWLGVPVAQCISIHYVFHWLLPYF